MLSHAPPPPGMYGWLFRHVPASIPCGSIRALAGDLSAGLTVATVAVPQARAHATLAGAAQYGLYTAIVMTTVGALLDCRGSSSMVQPTPSPRAVERPGRVPEGERVPAAVLLAF